MSLTFCIRCIWDRCYDGAKKTIWVLLRSPIWGTLETTRQEQLLVALYCFKAELFAWYPIYERGSGEILTRVSDITPGMIGTDDDKCCKTKGKETWGLLLFLLYCLQKYRDTIGPPVVDPLVECGRCLEVYVRTMRAQGVRVNSSVIEAPRRTTHSRFKHGPQTVIIERGHPRLV